MGLQTPELLTPDGDGDEERGVQQLEDFANNKTDVHPTHAQETVIFADPDYVDEQGRFKAAEHKAKGALSPATSHMSGMAIEATYLTQAADKRARQMAARRAIRMTRVLPGGGYGIPMGRS